VLGKAGPAQGQTAQGGRHSVTVQKFTNAAAVLQAASGNQNQVNLSTPSSVSQSPVTVQVLHEQNKQNQPDQNSTNDPHFTIT